MLKRKLKEKKFNVFFIIIIIIELLLYFYYYLPSSSPARLANALFVAATTNNRTSKQRKIQIHYITKKKTGTYGGIVKDDAPDAEVVEAIIEVPFTVLSTPANITFSLNSQGAVDYGKNGEFFVQYKPSTGTNM